MIYTILTLLLAGIFLLDYLPKRQLMTRPLRYWYLGVCLFCFLVLILDQTSVPFPRIATVITWIVEKSTGI
ncbi:hypothetical protein [Faecalispora anaeroviscerum]|uniref:hypothetical protein n=1 Tax=Faecalispora anaeroviscerum TaxID=2991836 RepID=UPI0024B9C347|nr:hypothetical protein [Faecalispora anaeroviscerum]